MKKAGKVILIFLAVIILLSVLAVGSLMIFKPDLVRAVYDGLVLDGEQIEEKKKENDKQLVSTINEFGLNLTEEDLEKLNNGELTEEEMKSLLLGEKKEDSSENNHVTDDSLVPPSGEQTDSGKESDTNINPVDKPPSGEFTDNNTPPDKTEQPDKTTGQTPGKPPAVSTDTKPEQKPSGEENKDSTSPSAEELRAYEERTAELVAKMYTLKSQYIGQINGVVASMKAEYAALPKEQQTMASKTSIANSYLGQISALETQCDAQVNSVVTELREVLKKSGKDMSLADAIVAAYNTEKETTKAAYINKYSD